jgi:hypothetical protein
VVECDLPKVKSWVRFPLPAHKTKEIKCGVFFDYCFSVGGESKAGDHEVTRFTKRV